MNSKCNRGLHSYDLNKPINESRFIGSDPVEVFRCTREYCNHTIELTPKIRKALQKAKKKVIVKAK